MITEREIPALVGATAYGADGKKIGRVSQVFLDDQTGQPEWFTVNTGLFGTEETFVPLEAAELHEDRVEVPYDKARIKSAPHVDLESGAHLSATEARLPQMRWPSGTREWALSWEHVQADAVRACH